MCQIALNDLLASPCGKILHQGPTRKNPDTRHPYSNRINDDIKIIVRRLSTKQKQPTSILEQMLLYNYNFCPACAFLSMICLSSCPDLMLTELAIGDLLRGRGGSGSGNIFWAGGMLHLTLYLLHLTLYLGVGGGGGASNLVRFAHCAISAGYTDIPGK